MPRTPVVRVAIPHPRTEVTRSDYFLEVVSSRGFGDLNNQGIFSMCEFGDYLYCGMWKNPGSGAEIWRTVSGAQQSDWEQCNIDGFGDAGNAMIAALYEYEGYIYAGTYHTSGAEVWRSADGVAWEQVNTNGFGDSNNDCIQQFICFDGYLYACVYNGITGQEIWRTVSGAQQSDWEQCNIDGFGNPSSRGAAPSEPLEIFNNYLYCSSYSNVSDFGGRIHRTLNGTEWTEVCLNGFGNAKNRGVQAFGIIDSYLYGLAANHSTGIEIWRTQTGSQQSDWERVAYNGIDNAGNIDGFGMVTYRGYTYVGLTNTSDYETRVYRTILGESNSKWVQFDIPGLGLGNDTAYEIFNFVEHNGCLYMSIMPHSVGVGCLAMRVKFVSRSAV